MRTAPDAVDEEALLTHYLDLSLGQDADAGKFRRSCYAALVLDARFACGQDEHGQLIDAAGTAGGRWIGGVAWLCLFDQIGQTLRLRKHPPVDTRLAGKRFRQALIDFAPRLSSDQRDILWALRNSLAHSYSLMGRDRELGPTYRFRLHNEPRPELTWQDGGDTAVNLRSLAALGNGVVSAIDIAHRSRALALNVTPQQLLSEWFVTWPATQEIHLDSSSQAVTGVYVSTSESTGASAVAEWPTRD